MKITFIQDHQSVASGNSHYKKGTQADLPKGQTLIELGVARAGWEPMRPAHLPDDNDGWTVEKLAELDLAQHTVATLREICNAFGLSHAGLRKAQLIAAIELYIVENS